MKATLTTVLLVAMTLAARPEIVTLKAYDDFNPNPDPEKHKTQSIEITSDQTIEFLSLFPNSLDSGNAYLQIEKDGDAAHYYPYLRPNDQRGLVLRGPAKITLISNARGGAVYATLRVSPERVDPTQTVIVYPGTNNAAKVTLLCSTNLADWSPATNGLYSGDVAKFFRIGIEKTGK